jgi:hypothetical protein
MPDDEYILFDSSTPIIIYGAGEVGSSLGLKLIHNNYNLVGFLDKNRDGIEKKTKKYIYRFGTENEAVDKSKSVVIICLADGMQHKSVAEKLYSYGYRYIICLPMQMGLDRTTKNNLSLRYNWILDGDFALVDRIESFHVYLQHQLCCEDSVIYKYNGIYTVWVREECLFTESTELWKGDISKVYTRQDSQNINISSFDEYRDLFSYFRGQNSDCDKYWRVSTKERTEEEKQHEIKSREALFRTYEREYALGLEFFICGAPVVVWNDNGYWNLHGGHHRTIFLQQRGHVIFPVKMTKPEFEYWCNRKKFDEIREYISDHKISKTVVPIPHPGFINFESERELCGDTILSTIYRYIRKRVKADSEFDILDCSHMDGYFARNFARQKKGMTVYADAPENIEFAKMINELLYVTDIEYHVIPNLASELNNDRMYSGVFLINREDIDLGDEYFQHKICKVTQEYLFVETVGTEQADIEKFIANTDFSDYEILHREVYLGKTRQVYVFRK